MWPKGLQCNKSWYCNLSNKPITCNPHAYHMPFKYQLVNTYTVLAYLTTLASRIKIWFHCKMYIHFKNVNGNKSNELLSFYLFLVWKWIVPERKPFPFLFVFWGALKQLIFLRWRPPCVQNCQGKEKKITQTFPLQSIVWSPVPLAAMKEINTPYLLKW